MSINKSKLHCLSVLSVTCTFKHTVASATACLKAVDLLLLIQPDSLLIVAPII